MIQINQELCIGCGQCVKDCISHRLSLENGKAAISKECIYCGHCTAICPVGAVSNPDYDMAAWVLSHFSKAELKVLEETTDRVAEAVKVILTEDIGQAMNRYNG